MGNGLGPARRTCSSKAERERIRRGRRPVKTRKNIYVLPVHADKIITITIIINKDAATSHFSPPAFPVRAHPVLLVIKEHCYSFLCLLLYSGYLQQKRYDALARAQDAHSG
jgi:hypothetical protein